MTAIVLDPAVVYVGVEVAKEIKTITKFKSYNLYKCLKCHHRFLVERTPTEQALIEKYIKSSEIKLD